MVRTIRFTEMNEKARSRTKYESMVGMEREGNIHCAYGLRPQSE